MSGSSTWTRPKPRTYEYNYQIQSAYYRPTIDNLDKGRKDPEGKTFAESSEEALASAKVKLQQLEEKQFAVREPLWKVHPYYVPEDYRRVAPHETSEWPESRPHFDLVSSYDLMVGYLGIRGMAEREAEKMARKQQ